MATSKTLTPTNVTISIPEMTDQPNASVFSNCVDKEADAINSLSLYSAISQSTLTNIVNTAKLVPTSAAIVFSGDSSTGTSLVGTAGVCFGIVKNVNATRMDYMVVQPSGGRIALGTINPSDNNAVNIAKVFS